MKTGESPESLEMTMLGWQLFRLRVSAVITFCHRWKVAGRFHRSPGDRMTWMKYSRQSGVTSSAWLRSPRAGVLQLPLQENRIFRNHLYYAEAGVGAGIDRDNFIKRSDKMGQLHVKQGDWNIPSHYIQK